MELTYREQIIQTINNLIEAREIIFEQIVNLAMSNEFSHLKDAFDQGDIYSFSLKHFEEMEDVNVQKIVKLCKQKGVKNVLIHFLNYFTATVTSAIFGAPNSKLLFIGLEPPTYILNSPDSITLEPSFFTISNAFGVNWNETSVDSPGSKVILFIFVSWKFGTSTEATKSETYN